MDNIKKYKLHIVSGNADMQMFNALSALDRLCVGNEGWSAESIKSEAEKDNGIVLCTFYDEFAVGLITGYTAVGEADITSVAVDPVHRRNGIAKALMEKFQELLPDDTENIFLEVRESNAPAIGLYEKCGFEKLSVRKNFYSYPDENAVVMIKKLKGQ